MFENFKNDLESLTPKVKEKALEIANGLMKKEGISEKAAITEAIKRAEEWFYDLGG